MAVCAACGFEDQGGFRFCPSCGTQQVGDAPRDPLIGRTLGGKYRVLELIGEGSMGTVYRGEHIALKKAIAIKVLRRDLDVGEDALRRFQREGIAAGQLSHPNVIQVFDFDRAEDGLVFLAMEFVEGRNLKEWLREHAPLTPEVAAVLIRQLLATLVESHRHGVVHRDLKPENVMVIESHGEPTLKVLDFGLSKLVDRALDASHRTMPGRVVGTPLYMAPEQWRGEDVDHRADLYATALILYEMLSGAPPFQARDITDVMLKATSAEVPSLAGAPGSLKVSEELDAVVQKGLAKDPDERFQTASQMMRALDAAISGEEPDLTPRRRSGTRVRASASGTRGRRAPEPRRRNWVVPAVAGVVLVLAGLALWGASGNGASRAGAMLVSALPDSALSSEQRSYLDLLHNARKATLGGDVAVAIAAASRALEKSCADAEAYVVRAQAYRRRHDTDLARADLQKALEMYPGYAAAAAGLGWLALDQGKTDEASQQFDAALAAQPDLAEAAAGRAAVLCARDDAKGAVELLDTAAATHPDSGLVQLWRGRAKMMAGDFAGAAQALVRARQASDVSQSEVCESLGDAYRGQGDLERAESQYSDALESAAASPSARRKLAELMFDRGRFDEAANALAPAVQAAPRDASLLVLRGVIEHGRGRTDAAIEALESALAGDVAQKEKVLALLGNLELLRARYPNAAERCAAAIALDDRLASTFVTWGIALFRQRDFGGAAEKLERAVALEPSDAFSHYCLGVIYHDYLGDPDRALSHFEAHKQHGGDRPNVDDWIRRLRG
jgi:serine/threonine protein kinase/tetratricopeptide (TPR) repeat protein